MGVMLQCFYWNCPKEEQREYQWWREIENHVPNLAQTGFTHLWLPPASKSANLFGPSMGYDPYDFYDLGDFNQKGSEATWFGRRKELESLIQKAHTHGLQTLADLVINHCNGADAQETNPIDGKQRWTLFNPKSGKFKRTTDHFHPCRYETYDDMTFSDMPDLSHRHPDVFREILAFCRFLVEDIGFDGFRYDFVKGYGSWIIPAIQEYRYQRKEREIRPYGVAEHWSSEREIVDWLHEVNNWNDNEIDAFDFPLRYKLKRMCDEYGFDMRELLDSACLMRSRPWNAVTFVDNHDFRGGDGGDEIVSGKLMAYAVILTHEGMPCVYWKDYFTYGLARPDRPNGIAALVAAHEQYAGGQTRTLWADRDFYAMERLGHETQPGLILAMNNNGGKWRGARVHASRPGACYEPKAWWSEGDIGKPNVQHADGFGHVEIYAPPRGYVVYAPCRE
ncbi:alpha-amylase family glycosyl hydrolase [Salidesulfovibrio onnuriiensis]|uniref:alpha-amylase family glycosyl hydrolase n=1 Tax=Salidesulfovibrio onnuriiensis TaxID=2583823 RepID=UPI0011C70E5E|nr:alpha-amylase family glycosyl hydrolase [Salidesulfovibrio onnuriiensis]